MVLEKTLESPLTARRSNQSILEIHHNVLYILLLFSHSVMSTLCDPMDYSMSGFPVLHHLPEFAQTHVHRIGDVIQPSDPMSSPSPPAFSLSQHPRVFSNESVLHIFTSNPLHPKYWSFGFCISPSNEYSGLISFKMDCLDLLEVQETPKSLFQHHIQKH